MTLPRLVASGAMSVRIQSAIADAMAQRRIAAGFTETRRLSGSTTASSRTRSSPPQPPGPLMSGMLGAIAIASVRASRQAEGGGGAGGGRGLFGRLVVGPAGACFRFGPGHRRRGFGLSGPFSAAGAVCGPGTVPRQAGRPATMDRAARRGFGLLLAEQIAPQILTVSSRRTAGSALHASAAERPHGNHCRPAALPKPPQGHLRLAFAALKFMAIP